MLLEDRLIFFPTRELVDTPAAYGLAYEDVWATTSDGIRVHGWAMVPADPPRAWLLFSHGNAGNISLRPEIAKPLVALGYAVLLYDYRGYGQSEGTPNEEGTYLDGEAMLAEAIRRADGAENVFLYGRSLGGGVSHELALRHSDLAGLITDCSFTSAPAMAKTLFPVPGMSLLLRTRYDNLAKLAHIRMPRLVIHGSDDEIVPYWMSEALRDATDPPAEHLGLRGAGHNDTFLVGGNEYYDTIRRFIERVRSNRA